MEIKRKSIITITTVEIFLIAYFIGCIIMSSFLFKYYKNISEALEAVTLRKPYMILTLFLLREMIIRQTPTEEEQFEIYLQNLRAVEMASQENNLEGISVMTNYKDIYKEMNTNQFCNIMKNSFTIEAYESCLYYGHNTMERGLKANIFQILSNIDFISNIYRQLRDERKDTRELVNDTKLEFNCIVCIICSVRTIYICGSSLY